MKKADLVKDIITVLNFAEGKKEYGYKVSVALGKVNNWYASNELMSNVLMRRNKDELFKIHHDVIEAIY